MNLDDYSKLIVQYRSIRCYPAELAGRDEPLNVVVVNLQPIVVLLENFGQHPTVIVGVAAIVKREKPIQNTCTQLACRVISKHFLANLANRDLVAGR